MHLCPRRMLPLVDVPAVYVLLNDNRKVCYIGETGRGRDGGIRSRLTAHQNRIPWWTQCLYFLDPAFSNENLRLWLEANLHSSLLPDVIAVSRPSHPQQCPNGPIFLDHIHAMCSALSIPLFESRPVHTWDSRAALAKAIEQQFNPAKKCAGHIEHVLTPRVDKRTRRVTKPGKYRPLLERLGVKFAADGRVASWASVPCPLPDLEPPFFPGKR